MMKPLRITFAIVAFVGIPTATYFWLTWPYWDGLRLDTSQANAQRIKPGMTIAEAEAILGGPPGDYRIDGECEIRFVSGNCLPTITEWHTREGRLQLHQSCCLLQPPGPNDRKRTPEDWLNDRIERVEWSPAMPSVHPLGYLFGCFATSLAVYALFRGIVFARTPPRTYGRHRFHHEPASGRETCRTITGSRSTS